MINFNNINYERIDFDDTKLKVNELINKLTSCNNFESYIELVKEINNIQNHIEEMYDYADIKNMRNSEDKCFKDEIEYWNDNKSNFDSLFLPFYQELNNSKFYDKLKEVVPSNFFRILECQSKVTSDSIQELTSKESELKAQYRSLNKVSLDFNGESKTISEISGFYSNKDRDIRKKAHDTVNDYYYSNHEEYDNILYELINVRNKIAKELGFNNYVDLSLYKLKRFDYNYNDIKSFRDNIIKYINPICKLMSEWQRKELGINDLKYYDSVFFTEMPESIYKGEDLLNELRKSFNKCDKEISNLFNDMLDNDYIDFVQRKNKVNFSITNYLTETCLPVITGNYKNNYLDIQTTTHEMGHSFQKYCASLKDRKYIVSPLLKYPTMEVAEMFSYSMELIMMKYVDNIFDSKDYKKYCFMKMYNLIANLPYICLVDEFQESIYSNENLQVEDIRNTWLKLVDKYNLKRSNSGHVNLDNGGYFYRQTHIYTDPFYYIDYALSNFGALSIWNKCEDNLDLFKELGSVASYYSFKEMIDKFNMPNPFKEETVEEVSKKLEKELINKRIN